MKASFLYGIRDVRMVDCPVPKPGPGDVLLQIASVGVCGSDVHYYLHGQIGNQVITAPIMMGHEFSARVAGLGEGVKDLSVGQLVAVDPAVTCGECEFCRQGHPNLCPRVQFCGTPPVNGVFAEFSAMPAGNCFPLPESFSADEGALLEPLGVAIHTVSLSHLKPGDTAVVLGAGPIGLLTAAVAIADGVRELYITEPLADRREFASSYLAHAPRLTVLDSAHPDVPGEIRKLTAGRGVDIVFDAAGAAETPALAAELVRPGGKIILAGIPVEDTLVMPASTVRRKGVTIKLVRRMKHTYPQAIRKVQTGQVAVKPLATHVFPLERAGEAMELVANYRDRVIKAVVRPGR
jgi:L-iditol 2-dehydrogenase